ncbi:Chitin synthase, class 3 [Allomyces arbusculus]|nr:Chitin synthase, class 3 [Allomyces arbusculus]
MATPPGYPGPGGPPGGSPAPGQPPTSRFASDDDMFDGVGGGSTMLPPHLSAALWDRAASVPLASAPDAGDDDDEEPAPARPTSATPRSGGGKKKKRAPRTPAPRESSRDRERAPLAAAAGGSSSTGSLPSASRRSSRAAAAAAGAPHMGQNVPMVPMQQGPPGRPPRPSTSSANQFVPPPGTLVAAAAAGTGIGPVSHGSVSTQVHPSPLINQAKGSALPPRQSAQNPLPGKRAAPLGGLLAAASNTTLTPLRDHEAGPNSAARGYGRKKSLVRRDRAPPPPHSATLGRSTHHQHVFADTAPPGSGGLPPGGPRTPGPMNISRGPMTIPRRGDIVKPTTTCRRVWVWFSRGVTFYALPPFLACFGMHDPDVQQAWREKMALCTIILVVMAALAFLTFGFNALLCQYHDVTVDVNQVGGTQILVKGMALDVASFQHSYGTNPRDPLPFWELTDKAALPSDRDASLLFQSNYGAMPACQSLFGKAIDPSDRLFECTVTGRVANRDGQPANYGQWPANYCHRDFTAVSQAMSALRNAGAVRDVYVTWAAMEDPSNNYFAYNGDVVDLNRLAQLKKPIKDWRNVNGLDMATLMSAIKNRDASYLLASNTTLQDVGDCLTQIGRVGRIDSKTVGCIAADVVLYASLIVILGLVLSRFFMAIIFRWFLAPKLGRKLSDREKIAYLYMRHASARRERDRAAAAAAYQGGTPSAKSLSLMGPPPRMFGDNSSLHSSGSTMAPGIVALSGSAAPSPRASMDSTSRWLQTGGQHDSPPRFSDAVTATGNRASNVLMDALSPPPAVYEPDLAVEEVMHMILLVTCYSEGEHGIRTTLDSLAATHYLDSHKLLFVIADGIITGAGEDRSTPDIIVDMMERDPAFPTDPKPYSYVAIAEGAKRHNMAKVHAGYYVYQDRRVPMVCVVKCGTPDEQGAPKPGNRGKRDSQVVLMSFLQKVMFDERMTPLEYDLFQKIHKVAKVTPDLYETVTMVDADTKVAPDCVERMVACFARDPTVMGLCGETQIDNKFGSWVTMIQVFEYYISHHLAKAFESVFGGVTCLPGCFCAYRIKAPKGMAGTTTLGAGGADYDAFSKSGFATGGGSSGHWVPILANPDIVEEYSENVVDTLHKKNLLLLGEDRYLTTLMLRTFPKRKMVFVPQATCQTMVPDEFKVLLSQRRRWINSTIHNLMELVLVRDLCGTFCVSMQFVIAMELVGTVVLPAAISFTIYLIVISFITTPVPIIPLLLLAAILGLPGVLILVTTREVHFIFWMLVYLLSLPVWNFILPSYAFWHFDDFSWGATRVVAGASARDAHGGAEGEFDSSQIVMKRYAEWEQIKRRAIEQAKLVQAQQRSAMQASIARTGSGASGSDGVSGAYYGVPNTLLRGGVVTEFDGAGAHPVEAAYHQQMLMQQQQQGGGYAPQQGGYAAQQGYAGPPYGAPPQGQLY